MTVPQSFDSLVAKLIVTGATREQALERARRALAEFEVDGMPTVLPVPPGRRGATRPSPREPFSVHTRWIETEFDNTIPPYAGAAGAAEEPGERERITVEVGGKRLEVVAARRARRRRRRRRRGGRGQDAPQRRGGQEGRRRRDGDALVSPMQGTIVKVAVADGDTVAAGDTDRRAGGDEDGAAAHRAQGGHRHRPGRRGRRRPSPAAP